MAIIKLIQNNAPSVGNPAKKKKKFRNHICCIFVHSWLKNSKPATDRAKGLKMRHVSETV